MSLAIKSKELLAPSSTTTPKPVAPRAVAAPTVAVPGSKDEFVRPVHHDASAQRALRDLEQHAGPTISARELMRAIDRGTADRDSNMAGAEFRDFRDWANAHQGELTAGAKDVMALYAKTAKSATAHHRSGVTDGERAQLLEKMKQVGATSSPPAVPPASGAPSTAKAWQKRAVENPDHIFKRQVRDRKWNNDPDAPRYSGHCAITSLAMAVEAYGLEKKGLDTRNHSKDQDTIDAVARQMPNKFMIEKNGGHTWLSRTSKGPKAGTYAYQMAAAAKKMGLHEKQHAAISMKDIDHALAQGHMLCLAGEPGTKFQHAEGHSFGGGHSVLVMGKTADGHYLVCDPLSKKGPTRLTAQQLASFNTRGYTSTEVWRG